MIHRPQSRQFLSRSRMQLPFPQRQNLHSSNCYEPRNVNRKFSANQITPSTNSSFGRNTVGNTQAYRIRGQIQHENNQNSNVNTVHYNYQLTNNNNNAVRYGQKRNEINTDKSRQDHQTFQEKSINQLTMLIKSLTDRVHTLQNIPKYQMHKKQFDLKNIVESSIEQYTNLWSNKLTHFQKKLQEKLQDKINDKISEKVNEKFNDKIQNKLLQIQQLKQNVKKVTYIQTEQKNKVTNIQKYNNEIRLSLIRIKQQNQTTNKKIDSNSIINAKALEQIRNSINQERNKLSNHVSEWVKQKQTLKTQNNNIISNQNNNQNNNISKIGSQPVALLQLCTKLFQTTIKTQLQQKQHPNIIKINQNNLQSKKSKQNIIAYTKIYGVDSNGYLMDSDNKYLMNAKNYLIKLDDKMIEKMKQIGIYTEEGYHQEVDNSNNNNNKVS